MVKIGAILAVVGALAGSVAMAGLALSVLSFGPPAIPGLLFILSWLCIHLHYLLQSAAWGSAYVVAAGRSHRFGHIQPDPSFHSRFVCPAAQPGVPIRRCFRVDRRRRTVLVYTFPYAPQSFNAQQHGHSDLSLSGCACCS